MRLYYDPITVNCRKVAAGFILMNVPFEEARVDYLGGGHKAPEYLDINPNASLPALVDGDFKLWESNAILQYAADKHDAFTYHPREPRAPIFIVGSFGRLPIGTLAATSISWRILSNLS